jgi:hypothetical protein
MGFDRLIGPICVGHATDIGKSKVAISKNEIGQLSRGHEFNDSTRLGPVHPDTDFLDFPRVKNLLRFGKIS